MLLGGEPFGEEIVMWWNFIGRSHDEIVAFRGGVGRPGRPLPARGRAASEKVMEAPPMPTVGAEARGRRRRGRSRDDPVEALREIGFLLERSRADTYRVRAYRAAADAVAAMTRAAARGASAGAQLEQGHRRRTEDGHGDHPGAAG